MRFLTRLFTGTSLTWVPASAVARPVPTAASYPDLPRVSAATSLGRCGAGFGSGRQAGLRGEGSRVPAVHT
jgi:hypothetical protein